MRAASCDAPRTPESMPANVCCFSRITFDHEIKGGMEVHTRVLSEGLARRGHRVTVLTTSLEPGLELVRQANGVTLHHLPVPTPGRYGPEYWTASRERFRRLHGELPFDVVWSEAMGAAGWVKGTAPGERPPLFTVLQGGTSAAMVTAFRACRSWRGGAWALLRTLPAHLRRHFSWYLPLLRASDEIVCPSPQTAREARWEAWVPVSKIVLSVNGVDTDRFRPDPRLRVEGRRRLGLDDGRFLLLNVGRLSSDKGVDVLVRAMASIERRVPGVVAAIVGVGGDRSRLENLVERQGLGGAVRFLGFVPNEELPAYYNACDAFVFPTLRVESFGIVLAEAMACGRPVVSSAAGGTRWVVEDGVSGILVPPRRVAALAEAVIDLHDDPERARRLAANARRRAVGELSQRRMVADTESVIDRLAGRQD